MPVVAFDAEGVRDLVRNAETGLLVPPLIPVAFADAISYLIERPEMRLHLGAQGRQEAERRTWDSVMDGLLGHYQRIVAAHTGGLAA